MKVEIKVPAMGESITEATVGTIIKASGTNVKMDDEVLELETDKVNQVLYAPQDGIVSLNVSTDDVVKIGQVIGYIEGSGTQAEAPAPSRAEKEAPSAPEEKPASAADGVRRTKEEFVQGLTAKKQEVSAPAKEKPVVPPVLPKEGERRETRRRMSTIRRVIARRLVEAQATTAMLTTFNEVDLTEVIALRDRYKEHFVKEHGVKLGFMSFFVKAAVAALQAYPDINSFIDGEEIVHREYYDLGIAVGTDRGLVVPVLRNCDRLGFAGIEQGIADFAAKAREGTLAVEDLQGGGFTITNGGVYGSLLSTPILNPPQSGILGMHKIQKRAVVIDDAIVARPMMYLALSYDHRIVDGKEAVGFLITVKECLEDPARLLLGV